MRVQRLTLLFCGLLLLISADTRQASSEKPAKKGKATPLCALIDLDKSPLGMAIRVPIGKARELPDLTSLLVCSVSATTTPVNAVPQPG